jgi:hypothetical protein
LKLIGGARSDAEAGERVVMPHDALLVAAARADDAQPTCCPLGAMKFGGVDRLFADGVDAP